MLPEKYGGNESRLNDSATRKDKAAAQEIISRALGFESLWANGFQ
jgi:hypothetical protein